MNPDTQRAADTLRTLALAAQDSFLRGDQTEGDAFMHPMNGVLWAAATLLPPEEFQRLIQRAGITPLGVGAALNSVNTTLRLAAHRQAL